jgi:GTP-binding protein
VKRPTVALVGRPNVGKSTLFNRIIGGRRAIVHDRPGVTRDRHFATAEWGGRSFWLVDTGGWIVGEDDPVTRGIREQVTLAIDDADVVVFVVDTQAGVHPADQEVADLLRKDKDRVVLAVNKADDLANDFSHHAFHELGIGDPVPLSAATGKGSGDLLDAVAGLLPEALEEEEEGTINVAVVGRPNVGKSSIMNRLLGADRSIVAPEAGTTRDAVDSPLRYHDRTLNFIDTAGLRRRPKVKDDIEFYSAVRTERAIDRAAVCVLVLDSAVGVHGQDLRVAQRSWEQGAGLIVAVNKWDLVSEKDTNTAERGRKELAERVPFFKHVPFVYTSALTGLRVRKLLDLIMEVAEERTRRIETAEVNRVLERLVQRTQPPQAVGKEVKLLYASQISAAPPTFAVVCSRPEAIPESYQRYLVNGFYKEWGFIGTVIRLKLRRRRERK